MDNKIIVWNLITKEKIIEIPDIHKAGVLTGCFGDDGTLITGGGDNLIKVIETKQKFI